MTDRQTASALAHSIGSALTTAIVMSGATVPAVAEILGTDLAWLNRVLAGQQDDLTMSQVAGIAAAVGCELDVALGKVL